MSIVHIAFLVEIVEELRGEGALARAVAHPSPLLVATEFVLIKREVDCAKHLA